VRAFDNCLVCGASTENTHSARRGEDALVCSGDCYQQASRNFKRRMNGYKVARIVDLLAQMDGPVTANQLLDRFRNTYGKSAMIGFNTTTSLTQQFVPIFNPETIRVDKSRKPFTFEYLGGTTIGEWLKPSMRAKYESVTFGAESDSYEWEWDRTDNAPTELIKKRLKDAGFSMTDSQAVYGNEIVEYYEPRLVAPNGVVLEVALSQNEEYDGFSRLTFFVDDDEDAPPMDWDILYEKGLLKNKDCVEYPQYGYYQVYWDGLYDEWKNGHNCADNAKFDIYEDDFIVMECVECGRTATFEQKTPYEGPRNAETFEAQSGEEHWTKIHKEYAPTELIIKRLKDSGVWELGDVPSAGDGTWDVIKWWATVKIKDGTLVRATLPEDFFDLTTINIILLDGQIEKGYGRVTVEYTDIDNPDWEDSYRDEMEKLGKDLTTIFENNGMFQSVDDDLQYGDMGEFYEVVWGDLIRHDCATNADFDIYEDDFIVMECNICGRTATFRQETPYEGPRTPRNAEEFKGEGQQKLDVSVGDRVRSYDFILPDGTLLRDDCYMEGRVTKIAPVDWCSSECDHYYILVDRVVKNGEEIDSKTFTDGQMVFPPVSESHIEIISESYYGLDRMDEMDAETNEYRGPFEVEIRRPDGSKTSWKKYDTYKELIAALDEIVSQRNTPYAIDVFASRIPYVVGFNVTGPVTDYRKYHLGTWKYGAWESGPWIHHFPQGIE